MKETIPILLDRRKRFTQRHVWVEESKTITVGQEDSSLVKIYVPSVLERLTCLFSSLENIQHPYRSNIRDIIQDIESFRYEDWKLSHMDSLEFEQVWDVFRDVTSAHKKHTDILHSILYHHDSNSVMGLCMDNGHHTTLRVPLPLYTGNLLIVFFCMGHCVSRLVEGLSEKKWLTRLIHDFSFMTEDQNLVPMIQVSPMDLYRFFLLYHSSILRTCPLRPSQLIELGMANQSMVDCMTSGQYSVGNGTAEECHHFLLVPPRVMRGMEKACVLDQIMNAAGIGGGGAGAGAGAVQGCSVFTTTFDFGSLGPAFRGRDNISHVYFIPTIRLEVQCLADLESGPMYGMARTTISDNNPGFLVNANRSSSHPFHALMNVIRESKKIRPINMEVPRIIFVTNTIQGP